MQGYSALLPVLLVVFCVSIFFFARRPVGAVLYLLWFRSTFAVAAFLHIPGLANLPFFAPAFGVTWLVVCSYYFVNRQSLPPVGPIFSFYVLTALMVISVMGFLTISGSPPSNIVDAISKYLLPIIAYFGVYAGLRRMEDINRLSGPLVATVGIALFVGLLQSATGYSYEYTHDMIVSGVRPVGTIIDANAYGIFLCLCAFLITPYATMRGRLGMKLLLALFVAAILFSKNRGSWIAALLAVACAVLVYRRHLNIGRLSSVAIVVVSAAFPVVIRRFSELNGIDRYGNSQDTFSQRVFQSKYLMLKAAQSPIFGYGAGSSEQPWGSSRLIRPPHNDYVRMVYEFGLIIAAVYVVFLIDQAFRATRLRNSHEWRFGFGALMAMIYVIIISSTQNVMYDTVSYTMIMIILAILHRTIQISKLSVDMTQASPGIARARVERHTSTA